MRSHRDGPPRPPATGGQRSNFFVRRRWVLPVVLLLVAAAVGISVRVNAGGDPKGVSADALADGPSPLPGAPTGSAGASTPPSGAASSGPGPQASTRSAKVAPKTTSAAPPSSFPNASNTGVPAGVRLKAMKGEIIVRKNGTVIDGIDLVGKISVEADNVTIRRSRITAPKNLPNQGRDEFTMVHQATKAKGLRLEDCEIDGSGLVHRAVMGQEGIHVTRCEMTHIGHGVEIGENYVVEDSWIHSTTDGPDHDWHVDGVISSIGNNGVVRHNTIVLTGGSLTGAVSIGSSLGPIDNVVVRDNFLAGGNYTLYIQKQNYPATRIQVIDNWFSTMASPKVGMYGIWYPSQLPDDLVRRGNKIIETGAPADEEPNWG